MPSWPDPRATIAARRVPDDVRRRVETVLSRSMRRVVRAGATLAGVGLVADAVHLSLRFGSAAAVPVLLELGATVASLGLAWYAAGRARRPEAPALAVLLLVLGVTLVNARLLPPLAPLANAYLVLLLAFSAMLLPWGAVWHQGWLGLALGASGVNFLVSYPTYPAQAAPQLVAVLIAAMASYAGHRHTHRRLRRLLLQQFQLRRLAGVARRQQRQVADLNQELVRTARIDAVTGIGNRRALDEALPALRGRRLAVVLLDLDDFKAFNDHYGHLAGDGALARFGEILRSVVRDTDLVFRYGGEEFLILLPDAHADAAVRVAERVRATMREDSAVGSSGLTVSVGVAAADRFASSSTVLLRRADAALYRAKRAGRDRIVVDEPASAVDAAGGLAPEQQQASAGG